MDLRGGGNGSWKTNYEVMTIVQLSDYEGGHW